VSSDPRRAARPTQPGRHLLATLPVVLVLAAFPGPIWVHIAVPVLFPICSVGIVAMYGDEIRVSRLRRAWSRR
jgi:hypothetical protein